MGNKEIRTEALADIMQEVGVTATTEQIAKIADDYALHIEMEREISHYQHIGHKEECQNCKRLESKLKETEKENVVFRNSVKQRRGASLVWVEDNEVKYEK